MLLVNHMCFDVFCLQELRSYFDPEVVANAGYVPETNIVQIVQYTAETNIVQTTDDWDIEHYRTSKQLMKTEHDFVFLCHDSRDIMVRF